MNILVFFYIIFYILSLLKSFKKPEFGLYSMWIIIWLYPNSYFFNILPLNVRFDDLFVINLFLITFSKCGFGPKSNSIFISILWILSLIISNSIGSYFLDVPFLNIFKFLSKAIYVPITVYLTISLIQSKDQIDDLLMSLMISGIFVSLLGIASVFFPIFVKSFYIFQIDSTHDEVNSLLDGGYSLYVRARGSVGVFATSFITLITSTIALVKLKNNFRYFYLFSYIIIITGLIYTQTRSAMLTAGFILILNILTSKSRFKLQIFFLLIFLLFYKLDFVERILFRFQSSHSEDSLTLDISSRQTIWDQLSNIEFQYFITGIGMYPLKYIYNFTAHNSFYGSLLYSGVMGFITLLIILYYYLFTVLKINFNRAQKSILLYVLFASLILGVFSENLQNNLFVQLFFVFIVISEKIIFYEKKYYYSSLAGS